MNAQEIIAELPQLNEADRRAVFRKLLELDDWPLSPEDEVLVESRLAEHRSDSGSSVSLAEMKQRLRAAR